MKKKNKRNDLTLQNRGDRIDLECKICFRLVENLLPIVTGVVCEWCFQLQTIAYAKQIEKEQEELKATRKRGRPPKHSK